MFQGLVDRPWWLSIYARQYSDLQSLGFKLYIVCTFLMIFFETFPMTESSYAKPHRGRANDLHNNDQIWSHLINIERLISQTLYFPLYIIVYTMSPLMWKKSPRQLQVHGLFLAEKNGNDPYVRWCIYFFI